MDKKPIGAFIFAITSGFLIITGALISIVFRVIVPSMTSDSSLVGMLRTSAGFAFQLSLIGFAIGVVVILSAIMLRKKPSHHVAWGAIISIFSILSVIGSWAGLGLGLIFGIVGGVMAIRWTPESVQIVEKKDGKN